MISNPNIFITTLDITKHYTNMMTLVSISNFLANMILLTLLVLQALDLTFADYFIIDRNQNTFESLKNA